MHDVRAVVGGHGGRMPAAELGHGRTSSPPGGFVESLLDNLEDMVFTCDAAGTITSLNRPLRAFLGVSDRSFPLPQWERLPYMSSSVCCTSVPSSSRMRKGTPRSHVSRPGS